MDKRIVNWYALAFCSGLSTGKVHDLVDMWCGDEKHTVEDLLDGNLSQWQACGLNDAQCEALEIACSKRNFSAEALEPIELAGLSVLSCDDEFYPPLLSNSLGRSRPPLLFCAGNRDLLRQPAISIIGSRKARPEALDFTRLVASALGRKGLVIVSGFAEGVDRAASAAALDAQGATILVLPQGILTFGRERKALSGVIDDGRLLVISAFEPRAEWQTPLAMARNAIIGGLSEDMIVGQLGNSGGSWESARMALNQGKRLWARADSHEESGCNALANLGAHLVEWPNPRLKRWIAEVSSSALMDHRSQESQRKWTEAALMRFLRTASASEIHDACSITGHLLVRFIEGRDTVKLNCLKDLSKITGLGTTAVISIAQAFGLSSRLTDSAQISLFPEIEDFPGWEKKNLAQSSEAMPPRPQMVGPRDVDVEEVAEEVSEELLVVEEPPRKRNLLFFLTSGLRADALACYGNGVVATPNLDRLAREGALCKKAYTVSPQESPARASLLTGQGLPGHGVWTDGLNLPKDSVTLASHLASHGYRTAFVGKMGLTASRSASEQGAYDSQEAWKAGCYDGWNGPVYGFNRVRLVVGQGAEAGLSGHYAEWLEEKHPDAAKKSETDESDLSVPQYSELPKEASVSSWVAEQTVDLLRDFGEEPFFLTCSFPGPHAPYRQSKEAVDAIDPKTLPALKGDKVDLDEMPPHFPDAFYSDDVLDGMAGFQPCIRVSPERVEDIRRVYHAMLAEIDEAVGRILVELDEKNLMDETLIVFTSDHGDLLGDHGLLGYGPFHYEGLIRVPMLWRLPDKVLAGVGLNNVVSHLDFVPTVCGLLAVDAPESAVGVDLSPYMAGSAASLRTAALVEFPSRLRKNLHLKTIVRSDAKMTIYPGQEYGEYFNLKTDPDECENQWEGLSAEARMQMQTLLLAEMTRVEKREGPPE